MGMDLMFVIDGSSSMKGGFFSMALNWTKTLVNKFVLEDPNVRVGVIQYSNKEEGV